MFNSLKKWVQDKAVDFTPPSLPAQLSPSSPSFHSSSTAASSTRFQPTANHYYYQSTSSFDQPQYHDRFPSQPAVSSRSLSRPISMESVGSSKTIHSSAVPPAPASPGELDLSHLNREEQEHIANVLRRARAVDEQQTPTSPLVISSKQSPPASLSPSTSSASTVSSSSTSTSSFHTEQPEIYDQSDKNDNNDDNEIRENEELPTLTFPESTFSNAHRCQVCNKEQQPEENSPLCLQCQDDAEIARIMQTPAMPQLTPFDKSPSPPLSTESHNQKEDTIDDNAAKIDQELIKTTSPFQGPSSSHVNPLSMEKTNGNQRGQEEKQLRHSPSIPPVSSLIKTRSNNLTEIDEDDFFYQGPSPYVSAIDDDDDDDVLPIEKLEESIIPTYKIDEYVEEDETNERDHVKELEETIANISRHFPIASEREQDLDLKSTEANFKPPSDFAADKIDIDSILEMEIESPSTDEHFQQLSTSAPSSSIPSSYPVHVPISIPIATPNRRGSLSRSSGVRENLTDLLVTRNGPPRETRSLQRTSSIQCRRDSLLHRQKRNLPSVPLLMDQLKLRRANSESHFSLPTVPPAIIVPNSNLDDESDLLEIDLTDPTGSVNRTIRSKTVSEILNSNDTIYYLNAFDSASQSPSVDELSAARKQTKQLRDQTTNTPPLASFNPTTKAKKKLKKKLSSPSANAHDQHAISIYTNGQITPPAQSPSQAHPPELAVPTSLSSSSSNQSNRAKLQKSTSTEISYPFPVSKLILSRDSLNPSRRDGSDLGLRITGGHSIPNCMEVTACVEQIDINHRNYLILQNAVQEGDEVLEVGGVALRGKSALFVQNLMTSIEDEFELVVRSQHVLPPSTPPVQIHKPPKSRPASQSPQSLTPSHLMVDSNIQRRHSMDTSRLSPTHLSNSTVVKSQSSIMRLPLDDSSHVSDQLLSPSVNRTKSVSSKERLFSVESLHRTSSAKSSQHLIKVATQSNETSHPPDTPPAKREEAKPTTTLSVTSPENKTIFDDSSRRRLYEHRNSLLPNDPGLNGIGSTQSIDRRSSNESDESDNLSQYFRSSSSRKSSLMATNPSVSMTQERSQSITANDNDFSGEASHRLQSFLKSNDEKRPSRDSTGRDTPSLQKNEGRKSSSTLGSFKFIKKKTKSVDYSSPSLDSRPTDYVGDIQLQIGHDSEREQLVVRIIQAKNLPAKDANGYSDPFVKVYLLPGRDQENKRRTKHVSKNLNPHWDHTVLYANMHREEVQYKMLEFTVWDYDRFKANDFIGQVTIDLKDANVIDDKAHWYRLQASRSRDEATNRGSSPRLFKNTSVDSAANSTSNLNKSSLNIHSPASQRK